MNHDVAKLSYALNPKVFSRGEVKSGSLDTAAAIQLLRLLSTRCTHNFHARATRALAHNALAWYSTMQHTATTVAASAGLLRMFVSPVSTFATKKMSR